MLFNTMSFLLDLQEGCLRCGAKTETRKCCSECCCGRHSPQRNTPRGSNWTSAVRSYRYVLIATTDPARGRVSERLHGLLPVAMRPQCHRLENHDLEPFVRPTFCLHLLSQRLQYCQCRGGVSAGQVDPRLTERKLMRVSQTGGRPQITQA